MIEICQNASIYLSMYHTHLMKNFCPHLDSNPKNSNLQASMLTITLWGLLGNHNTTCMGRNGRYFNSLVDLIAVNFCLGKRLKILLNYNFFGYICYWAFPISPLSHLQLRRGGLKGCLKATH
ncbi:hypothetical protein EB796_011732 [Bugula neritina]|uniref:Uncharacterized protein n=1 Tax=Bugula neritina TaxID=10212 RepID=A0A7J7JW54_BUGNE|nr:hypothetical protein EB796_011732 [Bugula neritina]